MDTELRFISSLLHSSSNDQAKFYASRIPLSVFVVRGREMQWIYAFHENHGQYPTAFAYSKKFGSLKKIARPYSAMLEPILEAGMFSQLRAVNLQVKEMLDRGDPITKVVQFSKGKTEEISLYSHSHVDVDTSTSQAPDRRYRETVAAMSNDGKGLIDSPWTTLNRIFPYARPGERITVAGRSSLGKTWIATVWAVHWASKGIRTGFFTKEMPADEIEDRVETIRYKLSYPDLIAGNITPAQLRRWRKDKEADLRDDKEFPLYIFGNESQGNIDYNTLVSKCREYRLDAAWIDGVYLIRPVELPANVADTQRFTYLSNKSKELAKMLNIVLGVTVQDGRSAESKDGIAKGGATTTFGADAWLQDTDILLHVNGKRGTPTRELSVSKVRKADLIDFAIDFQLDPSPSFKDKGPSSITTADEARIEKTAAKFKPLK